MTLPLAIVAVYWLVVTVLHVLSVVVVARKLRQPSGCLSARSAPGRISVVRAVNGLEYDVERCLESGFLLEDPDYELIFCAHDESDPAVPLVKSLMARHPRVAASLLCGNSEISRNPKLNNLAKSWTSTTGEWVLYSDGNTVLPPDHLSRHGNAWTSTSGVVSAAPIGTKPQGFWAEVECAYLNQYQARWYLMAAALGLGYCNGKSLMVRRADLVAAGGLQALASDLAEDVALTKLAWAQGRHVTAVFRLIEQPLGQRSAAIVLNRQARWARIRRLGYTTEFSCEVFSSSLLPIAAVGLLAYGLGGPVAMAIGAQILLWYGAELVFAKAGGLPLSRWTIPASMIRDATIPLLWLYAWFGRDFRWGAKRVYRD